MDICYTRKREKKKEFGHVYCSFNDQSSGCGLLFKLIHNKKKRLIRFFFVDNCTLIHIYIHTHHPIRVKSSSYYARLLYLIYVFICETETLICIVQT